LPYITKFIYGLTASLRLVEVDATKYPVKDEDSELPIPFVWRATICAIVSAFVRNDYELWAGVKDVDPIPSNEAEGIRGYIEEYGAELIDLPEDTWQSSVCIWMRNYWVAIVDLWTAKEGCSDLVLHLHIYEAADGGYRFSVHAVYVP
jgi:hypothetical protein